MSLFAQSQAAKANVKAAQAGPAQVINTTNIALDDLELLANALEAEGFKFHDAGVKNAGLAPTGEPMVALCCQKKAAGKTSTVTVYYNGRVVWAGIEPVDFKAPKAKKSASK